MAYLTGFDYDIFISYAHVNNQRASEGEEGWVTQFQKHFEVQLSTLVGRMGLVKIWWDPELDGNQLFDRTIQERVNRSAIFLAMTSKGYVASDYCQQELSWFVQKSTAEPWGLSVGDRVRVFNILLNNIPHAEWPEAYKGTSGLQFHDAERENEIGYPTDPKEKLFKRQLRALVEAVYRTLEEFKTALASAANNTEGSPKRDDDKSTDEHQFTVFLADTSDALRTLRRRVANELSQQGVRLTAQVPPPFEAGPHDDKVIAEIERADLCVHLIDAWPGREIENRPELNYPQHQAELALAHAGAQLIWAPQALDLQSVEDEGHRRFLDQLENGPREGAGYSFIRESPTALTREILVRLDQLKQTAQSPKELSAVLLDTHLKDQLHALDLSRFFLEHDVQPYINPEADDPTRNVKILEERLKQVSRLIIVFGDVAEEWVRARLGEAVKIAITEECPLKACGIYFAPPRQKAASSKFDLGFLPVYQFDSRDIADPESLMRLLGEAEAE
jgi:hypothetical protein